MTTNADEQSRDNEGFVSSPLVGNCD